MLKAKYIYVHAEPEKRKALGEKFPVIRKRLEQRNQKIKQEYQSGISINCLAEKYCLSLYAVRKIIYQK